MFDFASASLFLLCAIVVGCALLLLLWRLAVDGAQRRMARVAERDVAPGGFPATRAGTLRYVVLHHTGVADPHFDLMIEMYPGSELMAWRLPSWPLLDGVMVAAERIRDHRQEYLDYEGPISGDRGEVRRTASGSFWIRVRSDKGHELLIDEQAVLSFALVEWPNSWRVKQHSFDHA